MTGFQIVNGGFIDLKVGGLEDLGPDGLVDGGEVAGEVAGGDVGPGVEGLPPDVCLVSSLEVWDWR